MLRYSGPKTRHLDIQEGDGFSKTGRRGYLENRSIFVEQTYEVEQVVDHYGDANFIVGGNDAREFTEPEE